MKGVDGEREGGGEVKNINFKRLRANGGNAPRLNPPRDARRTERQKEEAETSTGNSISLSGRNARSRQTATRLPRILERKTFHARIIFSSAVILSYIFAKRDPDVNAPHLRIPKWRNVCRRGRKDERSRKRQGTIRFRARRFSRWEKK